MLKLIVGLGNPGQQYARTRHNAGFWFVDELVKNANAAWHFEKKYKAHVANITWSGIKLIVIKPETFMNLSGVSVQELVNFHRIKAEEIIVVHDELDLPVGQVKIKLSGGHAGHNGLRDIIAKLGSSDFRRIRLGIGRPLGQISVADYVLSAPSSDDRSAIDVAISKILFFFDDLVREDFELIMKNLHN